MVAISSLANPVIKKIARLKNSKGRNELGLFCAEGIRTIATLIASKRMKLVHLLATDEILEDVYSIAGDHEITTVSNAVMRKISSSSTPSGIMGVFEIPNTSVLSNIDSGVVLAGLQDPGNMGTLIRTAAALGVKNVICIEGTDPFGPKVVQASAGTIGMVTIMECSWSDLTKHATAPLCALVVNDGLSPDKIIKNNPIMVIGSESHGLSDDQINDCTYRMTIPMPGGTESLNAAVAGSIALYLSSQKA